MSNADLSKFIERIERLEEEKKDLANDIRELYIEAKSAGFNPKVMRKVVAERRMKESDRIELEALLDTYRSALGMLADTPLGAAAIGAVARG